MYFVGIHQSMGPLIQEFLWKGGKIEEKNATFLARSQFELPLQKED
jgi:hypothetical protein